MADDPRPPIEISDHAVVRYLERTGRVDIAALRRDLEQRAARCVAAGEQLKAGDDSIVIVRIDGIRLAFRRRVATTALESDTTRRTRSKRRRKNHARTRD